MKVAVAQINPLKGNVMANIEKHIQCIDLAVLHHVDALFFPELSIIGYEPALAKELVFYVYDKRLDVFQTLSNTHGMSIGIGVPIQFSTGIQISMIIFIPNKIRQVYSKQLLHPDELPYFVSGDQQVVHTVKNKKIVPAICYESLQVENAEQAHALGAQLYVASVAKAQKGMDKAEKHFPFIAKKFEMAVLMANCVGTCDNFLSIGKSSVWNKEGFLLGQLNETEEGILVFDSETELVFAKNI